MAKISAADYLRMQLISKYIWQMKTGPMKSATTTTKMKGAMMRAEVKTICTADLNA